jgi:hypothetical protein
MPEKGAITYDACGEISSSVSAGWTLRDRGRLSRLAMVEGWGLDRISPDRYDLIGGLVCLIGVGVIMYWPR